MASRAPDSKRTWPVAVSMTEAVRRLPSAGSASSGRSTSASRPESAAATPLPAVRAAPGPIPESTPGALGAACGSSPAPRSPP